MRGRLGLFRLAGCGYAVSLERLLRVVDGGRVAKLPLTPVRLAGMLVVGDEVIPLLDSDWLPGVVAGKSLSAGYQVLVSTEYGTVALPADTTIGIVAEGRGDRSPVDQEGADYFSDCFYYRDSSYQVLNIDVFIMDLIRSCP